MLPGVYQTTKKNGQTYYRSSFHYKGRHISLGSFSTEERAHRAYQEATRIVADLDRTLEQCVACTFLSFEKVVSIVNYRDNGFYIKNPIYLQKGYFQYYLSPEQFLLFDNDDLFYYSQHKIICRQGHMFVNDYGMQYNILARYGIKNYGVAEKDYTFANGNPCDYRYSNIIVINKYHGVSRKIRNNLPIFEAKLHLNGELLIGRYNTQAQAAIAYNKAVDLARAYGIHKNFIENYITELSPSEYASEYQQVAVSESYLAYLKKRAASSTAD